MACGLMMLPRITSASLRGSGEFVWLTALVWEEIIDRSLEMLIRVNLKGPLPSLTDFIPGPSS
jgi:hypothetical protein